MTKRFTVRGLQFAVPASIAIMLLLASCKYKQEYNTVNAGNKFSVSVPSWLKEEDKIKDGALFQYANHYRNFYSIGEVFDKSETTRTFSELNGDIIAPTVTALSNPVINDSVGVEVNSMKGIRTEIFGKMSGEHIYYSHILLEGKNNLIHLCIWTRGEDRKLKYKEDIDKILLSIREL